MEERTLGALIRSLRIQNDLTQAALGQKMGVTDKAVSKWERDISYPDVSLFPKLADVLGVSTDDLLSSCTDEKSPSRLMQIFEMSHDIRTPLNIILGCASLAAKNHGDTERLLRYLENIRISGEYLLHVIGRVMALAHLDSSELGSEEFSFITDEAWKSLNSAAADVSGYDFSGKRILLAEDMEVNREITFEMLKSTGVTVEYAKDGAVCVDMVARAEEGYYDLILMDIEMPNMDGVEATRCIRALADKGKASIPIIAMTANVYEKDRKRAFEAGMNCFAEKPVDIEKLCAAMSGLL